MKKSDLVKIISSECDISINRSDFALNALINGIIEELATGNKINFTGFGTFASSERAERKGRDPKTGAPITINACKTIRFTASRSFKIELNQS